MKRANKYKVLLRDNATESPEKYDENQNGEELKAKIQELRKKARQETVDGESLSGLSLAQYLRLKQSTNKLLAMEDGKTNGTGEPQNIDPSKAEDEKKKMSYTIIKKWKNFARSGNKKTEEKTKGINVKRRKSVRFKPSSDETDSPIEKNGQETDNNNNNLYSSRVVFPAIATVNNSSQHKEKKPCQDHDFLPRLIPEGNIRGESSNRNRVSASDRLQDRLPPIMLTPLCLTNVTSSNSDTDCESPTSPMNFPVQLPKDAVKENKKSQKEQLKRTTTKEDYVGKNLRFEKENEMKKRNIRALACNLNSDSETGYINDKFNRKKVPFSAPNSPSGSPRLPTPFPNSLSEDSLHEVGLSFGRDTTPIWRIKKELYYSKNVDESRKEKKSSPKLDESKIMKTHSDIFMKNFDTPCEEDVEVVETNEQS